MAVPTCRRKKRDEDERSVKVALKARVASGIDLRNDLRRNSSVNIEQRRSGGMAKPDGRSLKSACSPDRTSPRLLTSATSQNITDAAAQQNTPAP